MIASILVITGFLHSENNDELRNALNQLSEIEKLIYQDMESVKTFLLFDAIDAEFYKTGTSLNVNNYKELYRKIKSNRNTFEEFKYFDLNPKINILFSKIELLDQKFSELLKFQLERGFNDFGLEGSMNDDLNWLDKNSSIPKISILMLRRYEKDYVIQQQISYVRNHNELINNILNDKKIEKKELSYIKSYHEKFSKLVELDSKIGRSGKHGITKKMKDLNNEISLILADITKQGKIKQDELLLSYKYNYFSFAILFILTSIIIGFYVSHRLSKQLRNLSSGISDFVSSNFTIIPEIPHKGNKSEIHILSKNFLILRDEIVAYIKDFEEKVKEQTTELTFQKIKIEEKNKKILLQKQILEDQFKTIVVQNEKVSAQKKRLLESIKYAKYIQDALLPNNQTINRLYKSNFIFYKPKDILSGDFYWFKKIESIDINITINIVADCTGHGVPGALLSMLGISYLNDIIVTQSEFRPDVILNKLREYFINTLQQMDNQQTTNDGLDIAISVIDNETDIMYFAGANRNLYLIRNNKLEIILGDRMPIGKHICDSVPFNNITLKLMNHDNIYMFTDGFEDQFGGEDNCKFMRNRFRKLLLSIQNESFEQQETIISKHFSQWQGKNIQVDDVLVVGFEYNANAGKNRKNGKNLNAHLDVPNTSLLKF